MSADHHHHHRSKAYYDDFAHGYERERHRGYHAMLDDLEIAVAAPLARGKRVCEAGCGTGLILHRLAAEAELAAGFDLSGGMAAKAHARGLPVVLGSVVAPPFRPESFDLVVCFKVLAHVPDLTAAIEALARLVVPGGRLLLELYNPWSLRYVAKRLAGPGAISANRDESHVFTRWTSPLEVRRYLPPGVRLEAFHGVRVWTPAAFVHRIPILGTTIRMLEHASIDSPLRFFGGFLVAELVKL
ncbi:MAG: class I SAM-dependent methyltransferase [Deltaproteobacteria bacterium]|nr:class I SAM-dependent methyltransferase [Deltaproteobacteria bacterium]